MDVPLTPGKTLEVEKDKKLELELDMEIMDSMKDISMESLMDDVWDLSPADFDIYGDI